MIKKLPRSLQGLCLAIIILTIIVVALMLAQAGVAANKQCAYSLWWLGCLLAEHESLAGGLIGAGGALFAGWLAWSAIREQIDLERASNEPEVVAYLIPDKRHINILHLVVANVGRGTARNVSFEIEADSGQFSSRQIQLKARTRTSVLSVLPQSERVYLFFGSVIDILQTSPLDDFDITVRFDDMYGNARANVCKASVMDFVGQGRAGTPPEYVVAESLKSIADEIAQWSSGFKRLKVQTLTAEEEERQQREQLDAVQARRAARDAPNEGG
jgi:hypothetical protein